MADMQPNQQPWENQWQQAFEGAETPPPAHVWKNIEGELAVQESGKYRRGFLLYRTVAAVLLLLIAGLTWYILARQPTTNSPVAVDLEDSPKRMEQSAEAPLPTVADAGNPSSQTPPAETETQADPSSMVADADQSNQGSDGGSTAADAVKGSAPTTKSRPEAADNAARALLKGNRNAPAADILAQADPDRPAAAAQRPADARPSVATVAPVASLTPIDAFPLLSDQSETILYRVPQIPTASTKEDRSPVSFFAGLSLAPGYFDPQFQANAGDFGAPALSPSPSPSFQALDMRNENAAYQTPAAAATVGVENTPELSFTYGFDVGMRLSDHWVLESGVDYNRFSTSTATRWVVADVASGQRYAFVATNANTLASNLNQAPNTSTDLNNAYEFIAVPMKIGYRRSVSKFQFTVSSGVAANFFLRNAISASSAASELSTYRITPSKGGNPFNDVYYSGLLSGGVNYNVLGRYYLSLTPTYAFALTPLTRVSSSLDSNPYSFGVNVGFQYQF